MGTRLNRYYNNPEIGAAMSNIASMFAPMAPQDIAAYATAEKLRTENEGLSALYGAAGDPNSDPAVMDRWLAATGMNPPTQGFGALAMGDATDRRNQDVASAAARYGSDQTFSASTQNNVRDNSTRVQTNALDNQTRAIGDLFAPVGQGQVRPGVPDEFMSAIGLPGVDEFSGLAPNLSQDEVMAQEVAKAIEQGLITPDDAATAQLSDIPMKDIVNATGQPEVAYASDAVGQQPYVNPGSKSASSYKQYRTRDGRQSGIVLLDPTGGPPIDAVTRQPIPADVIMGDVQDTAEGMTTSASTEVQKRALSITGALETIQQLDSLITNSPASQGIVGAIRGTAQDAMQTSQEMATLFGGTLAEVQQQAQMGLLDQGLLTQMYDPNIPAVEMLSNVLAWQYAKSMGGDRVSNEQLKTARAAIGESGWLSNQASSQARLATLRETLVREGQRLSPMLPPQVGAGLSPMLGAAPGAPPASNLAPAPAPAARPRATNPQTGAIVEWDGTAWVPAQ